MLGLVEAKSIALEMNGTIKIRNNIELIKIKYNKNLNKNMSKYLINNLMKCVIYCIIIFQN